MNKKGAAISIIDIFGTITIFILIGIFLYVILLINFIPFGKEKELIQASSISGSDISLMNFLRNNISLDLDGNLINENFDMAYLINLWSLDNFKDDSKFKTLIEEKAKIFEKIYGDCYSFEINNKNIGGKYSGSIPTQDFRKIVSEFNYMDQLNNKINVKLNPSYYFYIKSKFSKDYDLRCNLR